MTDAPDPLARLGVRVVAADDGFAIEHCDIDWLRAVFVALGFRAHVGGGRLLVASADRDSLGRVVCAALSPAAVVFDLDGVLADIAGRRRIAAIDDVRAIAARVSTAVVTTCPRRLAESVLERHGFAPFVDVVISSDDGPCKPDPYPVTLALQRLEVDAAWMLGDNPSDVTAARQAGVVPFAILPRGIGAESHMDRLRGAGAARLVEGVAALHSLLAS